MCLVVRFVLCGLLAWCAASVAAAQAAPVLPAGSHELQLRHEGRERGFIVHVPKAYRADRPAPLVLALHGGGGSMEVMAKDRLYGLVSQSEASGWIVVFPNGFSRLGGKLATWNAGICCGAARDRDSDDVGFLRAVVAEVQRRVAIDPQRIFATGMSNGGMMAHRLACDAADVFAAVASVAGTEAVGTCQPVRPIPVLHIHAKNDTHVLFNGGAGKDAFRDDSKVMDFVSVPETIARWVQRNRCQPAPRRVLEKPGAYCEVYSDCASKASVQLCVVQEGGHSWPGTQAQRRGKEPPTQALVANDVIWDFFLNHP